MAHRLEITISPETLARLDEVRGHEKRASFVKRALDSALGDSANRDGESAPVTRPETNPSAASSHSVPNRAPAENPAANILGAKVRRVPSSRQAALNKAKGL